jgi:hypothetical protein
MFVDEIVEKSKRDKRNDSGDKITSPVDVDAHVDRVVAQIVHLDDRPPHLCRVWKSRREFKIIIPRKILTHLIHYNFLGVDFLLF